MWILNGCVKVNIYHSLYIIYLFCITELAFQCINKETAHASVKLGTIGVFDNAVLIMWLSTELTVVDVQFCMTVEQTR